MGDLSLARSKFGMWWKRHGAHAGKQGRTLSSRLGTRRVLSDQPTEPADDLTMRRFLHAQYLQSRDYQSCFFLLYQSQELLGDPESQSSDSSDSSIW
jgi:hypothetical protein